MKMTNNKLIGGNKIAHTEQLSIIFNREKELRNQSYSWDEINRIIREEFDLYDIIGIDNDELN